MSNAPSTGAGFSGSPYSPEYMDLNSKDNLQQITSSKLIQGSPWNPGVILAKDSLQVPLETQFGITDEKTNPGKPTLMPLFRTRYVDDHATEDKTQEYYQGLKANLPQNLQDLLNKNETQYAEDKDPDVIALDMSLRFEANWLAISDGLSVPSSQNESTLIGAQQFLNMPIMVKMQMLDYGTQVSGFLDHYLATTSSNDPGYDTLLNASNLIKDALVILNQNPTAQAA